MIKQNKKTMKILSSLQNLQNYPPLLMGKLSNRFQIEKMNVNIKRKI